MLSSSNNGTALYTKESGCGVRCLHVKNSALIKDDRSKHVLLLISSKLFDRSLDGVRNNAIMQPRWGASPFHFDSSLSWQVQVF